MPLACTALFTPCFCAQACKNSRLHKLYEIPTKIEIRQILTQLLTPPRSLGLLWRRWSPSLDPGMSLTTVKVTQKCQCCLAQHLRCTQLHLPLFLSYHHDANCTWDSISIMKVQPGTASPRSCPVASLSMCVGYYGSLLGSHLCTTHNEKVLKSRG